MSRATAARLRKINRQRGKLSDLLAAIQHRMFVDEHNEADRAEALDMLERYTHVIVDELMHVCTEGDRLNAEAKLAVNQWRFM